MKTDSRYCKKCQQALPKSSFTSSRAWYCNNCVIIRKMEQQKDSRTRQIDRLTTKKQKTQVVKSKRELQKSLQVIFNKWIRERDKDLPCISCGKTVDKYHAGHFIAQGFSGFLRYNEDNCHKQCVGCNLFKRGNLLEYRIELVKKIGKDKVEWLEEHRKDTYQYSREELLELLEKYK